MNYLACFSKNGASFDLRFSALHDIRLLAMACGAWANVFLDSVLVGQFDHRGNWHSNDCPEDFWQLAE